MRVKTLEIRWHDQKPISTCDFQPLPHARRSRQTKEPQSLSQCYRLATGGEDNNVRVRSNVKIYVKNTLHSQPTLRCAPPHPPRVEYRSTLSKHSAAVNVVRFSPNGELLASAGDDGMIIIWCQTDRPPTTLYGSENNGEEDPEHWKVRISFRLILSSFKSRYGYLPNYRCTINEIYDLAWSPTGEYVIAGSTDNAARIFNVADGSCVRELAEHNHYVQGVAWDPMNEFIATQSSDRAVHVYSVSTKHGSFETHAIGKNVRMSVRTSRAPSVNTNRPRMMRRSSTASDAESAVSELPQREEPSHALVAPPTPSTSIASTPNMFPPPQIERSSSRRSSFSGSNAPVSPAPSSSHGHFGRSPSPMPPLPAIRPQPGNSSPWTSVKLYGDESFTNFFRRLTFSPDGAMLLTPAGHFEDPAVIPTRGRKGLNSNTDQDPSSASSVYIYTRANFARSPVAQLPGHKKPSVAVKFSPILYDLRPDLTGDPAPVKRITVERGQDTLVETDIGITPSTSETASLIKNNAPSASSLTPLSNAMPAPSLPLTSPSISIAQESLPTPITPHTSTPASVFALPYRMLFSIATMDTITVHDTQQTSPICMFSKLHYDEFTDMTWFVICRRLWLFDVLMVSLRRSPDGQCLMLSSRDGFCTIVIFDEHLPQYHTQQQALQLQSLAHSIGSHPPLTPVHTLSPIVSTHSHSPSIPAKRSEPPSGSESNTKSQESTAEPPGDIPVVRDVKDPSQEPPKKKRRVALTHLGDIGPHINPESDSELFFLFVLESASDFHWEAPDGFPKLHTVDLIGSTLSCSAYNNPI
ncbi:hypothetical protein Clacol_009051 [Clathrus columnatus]|uniref:CAF1B/HIR1 beta-propeller domain-containing protein n=1 Tax=Clathrus columnatus TaxID=1419009 RepID=A0AAV5AP00_9AGAM|nr:hypothetical protein Clacol_009051 [Clathrus columnatus]